MVTDLRIVGIVLNVITTAEVIHELIALAKEIRAAGMRVLIKRILRKYAYPPDLQDAAVRTVLQQAEVLSARWAA